MEQYKVFTNPGPATFNEVMGENGLPMVFETEQEARDFVLEQDSEEFNEVMGPLRVGRVSADGATHILDAPAKEAK
jgi:hypothetical protein